MMKDIAWNYYKLLFLIFSNFILFACLGLDSGGMPVIYNHPQSNVIYHNNPTLLPETRIQFEIEFPDGLPAKASTRIELNGINIAPEFNDWGVSEINVVKLGAKGSYTALLYPTVASAIKAGANTFQLIEPVQKNLIYFQADLSGAEVFITEWHDTYCGFSPSKRWLSASRMNDDCVTDIYLWPGNAEYPPRYFKSVNPNTQSTRSSGADVFVRGYVDANTAAGFPMPSRLDINRISTAANGVESIAPWNPVMIRTTNDGRWADPSAGIPIASGENQRYGYFGSSGAMCNYYLKYMIDSSTGLPYRPAQYNQTVNLAANEFCAFFPDDVNGNEMSAIQFTAQDYMGIYRQKYLRSHVPLKDSRLSKSSPSTVVAGLSLRLGEPTIKASLEAASLTIEESGNLLTSRRSLITIVDVQILLAELYIPQLTLDFDLPSTSGRLLVTTQLDGTRAIIQSVANCSPGYWDSFNTGWPFYINIPFFVPDLDYVPCLALRTALNFGGGSKTAIVSGDIDITIDIGVRDASSASNPNKLFSNVVADVNDLSVALDLGSGVAANILGAILNALIGVVDGIIASLVDEIVSDIVGGIIIDTINSDLPLLRLSLPWVDDNGQTYQQYLGLKPEIETFTTSASTYNSQEMGMNVELGFHTKGNPRINKSPGAVFETSSTLVKARMARTVGGQNPASAGIMITSNFLNQFFMGLWESGILAWNFNTGNNSTNSFLNNVDIRFISATPWIIKLISSSDPEYVKGNFRIKINDLNLAITGDIYDPFSSQWIYDRTFLELNFFLDVVVRVSAVDGKIKVDFETVPFAYVSEFSSDYLPGVNEDLANSILVEILPLAATELESIEIGFPEISGAQIQFKDIWVENSNNLAVTFDITVD